MPIHDWTRVMSGTFHAFHVAWLGELQKAMNNGVLPDGYYALAEQSAAQVGPDVLTLKWPDGGPARPFTGEGGHDAGGGHAVAAVLEPPRTAVHDAVSEASVSAARRRRHLVVRNANGDDAVAVIEIVSPGNKSGRAAVDQFVAKALAILDRGLHLQVIDLFPPGAFDPTGMHGTIWAELGGQYESPVGRPLTLAAYVSGGVVETYAEPTAVGLPLVDLPLFLTPADYVNVPLEATYSAAYQGMPRRWREVIEGAPQA